MTMKRARVFLAAATLIAAFSFASGTQAIKAANKYAAYCGEYSFDLSSYGAGLITAKFYVENDSFYIWADKSEPPDVMSPVENEPTKYFLDDPEEGHWDIEFLEDDQGKFTKCRLVNPGLGINVVGEKIDD
jgi:hypothetical protein